MRKSNAASRGLLSVLCAGAVALSMSAASAQQDPKGPSEIKNPPPAKCPQRPNRPVWRRVLRFPPNTAAASATARSISAARKCRRCVTSARTIC